MCCRCSRDFYDRHDDRQLEQQSEGKHPDVPCFLVAATLFPCLTAIATSLPQDSMLEQTETIVVMLTKVLFEKKEQ